MKFQGYLKHYIQLAVKLLNFQRRIDKTFTFQENVYTPCLISTVNPLLSPPTPPPGDLFQAHLRVGWEGSLKERGHFFLNIVKVMIINEELECKVENLRYLELGVLHPKIKNRFKISASE